MSRRSIDPQRLRRIKRIFAPLRAFILCSPMFFLGAPSASPARLWIWSALALLFVDIVVERWTIPAQAKGWRQDGGTKATLGISFLLVLGLAFAERGRGPWLMHLEAWSQTLRWVGLGLLVSGVLLRQWAIQTLGRHFTDRARILEAHQLVQSGPYRWVRHPSYSALVLIYFGFASYLASPLALLLCSLLLPWALWQRINTEEALLQDHFGIIWERFAAQRGRLLPRLINTNL